MKIFFLRMWVMWRRFRRGNHRPHEHRLHYETQVEALLRHANPFASWHECANWMIDIAEWLRRESPVSLLEESVRRRIRHQRLRSLLDWLDTHRDTRKLVQASLQKTLREAAGPELFCVTGLPREPAFFSELGERIMKFLLPRPMSHHDLSALFTAMFPDSADAQWLLELDQATLLRLAKLCADDGIIHAYLQQIDEALTYLTTMVVAAGVSPDFRQRLGPKMPLQATPFMALRREVEKYLMTGAHDDAALRSVRMLIAVCQAQTDRVYEHLDEYGVSVGLVYSIERMRAQLMRMARLIDLRAAAMPAAAQGAGKVQALLADLASAHHHRSSVRGLVQRSFALLARKMVERNADHGEQYAVRTRAEYHAMLKAGSCGGILVALAVWGQFALSGAGLARFFEGLFASLNYAACFMAISAIGGVLAARQPAVTAPALAAKMGDLYSKTGLRALLQEIMSLLRFQSAGVFGNLLVVVPAMALLGFAVFALGGAPLLPAAQAHASMRSMSLLGMTPLFAALTGVLIWLSSLVAGFADNWFALRQLRSALAHHRRLVHALGAARAARMADWIEQRVAGFAGNVSLALLLGMGPVVAQFFGMPLDVRHVALSAGTLVAAAGSIGWSSLATSEFWWAAGGIVVIALLNVGVALACALMLALRARDVPARLRRLVFRQALRKMAASPLSFLYPRRHDATMELPPPTNPSAAAERQDHSKTGS